MRESEARKLDPITVRAVEIASECDIYTGGEISTLATGSGYEYALGAMKMGANAIVGGKREDDVTLWWSEATPRSQLPAKMDFTFLMLLASGKGQLALLETVRLRPGYKGLTQKEWWITGERIVAFGVSGDITARGSNICNLNTQKLFICPSDGDPMTTIAFDGKVLAADGQLTDLDAPGLPDGNDIRVHTEEV
ncbi:hypothetical protein SPFM12_00002 [Salmonella phage SPFM12]|nr:hypothetical protein SPFM12_00002 [Salmonella phage SPFM12]